MSGGAAWLNRPDQVQLQHQHGDNEVSLHTVLAVFCSVGDLGCFFKGIFEKSSVWLTSYGPRYQINLLIFHQLVFLYFMGEINPCVPDRFICIYSRANILWKNKALSFSQNSKVSFVMFLLKRYCRGAQYPECVYCVLAWVNPHQDV